MASASRYSLSHVVIQDSLTRSWPFSRKAEDETGLLFLPLKETLHYAGKAEELGAGTSTCTCWVHRYIFGRSAPSLSKHPCAALERGDGKKLLGLARDHVRVSVPTSDRSFILNPVNWPLLGSISQPPQLILPRKCAVPWALPLFLPPNLVLWALSLFSSPMLLTLNFANFSPPLLPLHIHTVTSPLLFPDGNSVPARAFCHNKRCFLKPCGKDGIITCQDTCSVHHYASQCWSHFVSICFSSGPKDLLTHYTKWGGFPAWKCIFKNLTLLNDSFC